MGFLSRWGSHQAYCVEGQFPCATPRGGCTYVRRGSPVSGLSTSAPNLLVRVVSHEAGHCVHNWQPGRPVYLLLRD